MSCQRPHGCPTDRFPAPLIPILSEVVLRVRAPIREAPEVHLGVLVRLGLKPDPGQRLMRGSGGLTWSLREWHQAPIVQDYKVGPGQLRQDVGVRAVTLRSIKVLD